jgi:2,4-dienoyl-CoA reductase-like NADH-dependent reductase (Old Yellow Enzyme family)
MYEHLAGAGGGPPNEKHFRLYELWAKGGWGMILTGNVQVSPAHLSLGADSVIPQSVSPLDLEPWKRFAAAIHASYSTSERPLAVIQLSHSGRQSPRFVGGRWPWVRALAPSARRLGSDRKVGFLGDLVFKIGFDIPKSMTRADIDRAVKQFVHGATVAWKAGFDGVELHASHGCRCILVLHVIRVTYLTSDLISQFVSRKV